MVESDLEIWKFGNLEMWKSPRAPRTPRPAPRASRLPPQKPILIPKSIFRAAIAAVGCVKNGDVITTEFVIPPHRTLAEIEKMAILQTLQRTNWNKQEAAQILGLYRPTLYSKMKKHEIQDGGKGAARRAIPAVQ